MIQDLLEYMRGERAAILDQVRELAEIESPSGDRDAVNRAVDLFAGWAGELGTVERFPNPEFGDHLRVAFDLGDPADDGIALGLGHLDTVYPDRHA